MSNKNIVYVSIIVVLLITNVALIVLYTSLKSGMWKWNVAVSSREAMIQDLNRQIQELNSKITETDISNWKTYRNGKYGFEMKYPPILKVEEEIPQDPVYTAFISFFAKDCTIYCDSVITIYIDAYPYSLEEIRVLIEEEGYPTQKKSLGGQPAFSVPSFNEGREITVWSVYKGNRYEIVLWKDVPMVGTPGHGLGEIITPLIFDQIFFTFNFLK